MSVPAALVAVMVKFVWLIVAVGVPEITPVVAFRERPPGKLGEIDQEVTGEPEFVGEIDGIADPLTTDREFGSYRIPGSTTVQATCVVALRPLEVRVTVSFPAEAES